MSDSTVNHKLCRKKHVFWLMISWCLFQPVSAMQADEAAKQFEQTFVAVVIALCFVGVACILLIIKYFKDKKIKRLMMVKIKQLTREDELTQLLNRKYMEKRLYQAFEWQLRNPKYNAVLMMLDIDDFKSINDNYGISAGDLVIQTIGNIIVNRFRTTDLSARMDGDEFLVLLQDTTIESAKTVAEQLRQKINNSHLQFAQEQIVVSCSIGLVPFSNRMDSCRDWIQETEQAMYQAKKLGKNQIVVYNKS